MKHRFQDQSISKKISIYLFAIIIVFVFIFSASSLLLYYIRSSTWYYNETKLSAEAAKQSLETHYDVITGRFVTIYGTEDFATILHAQKSSPNSRLRQGDIQSYLSDLKASDYLIDSVICLLPSMSTAYSDNRYTSTLNPKLFSNEDMERISGITWLSDRNSPIYSGVITIPVVYPLTLNSNGLVSIADSNNETLLYIIVYLRYDRLSVSINNSPGSRSSTSSSEFFLFSKDNILLNSLSSSDSGSALEKEEQLLKAANYSLNAPEKLTMQNERWYLSYLEEAGVYLLYHTKPASLLSMLGISQNVLVLMIFLLIAILATISMLLSRYISKPIRIQAEIVRDIELGRYKEKKFFKTNDEIGRLNKAINQMHDTIQSQIEQIKKEESEKYVTQMLRTAEQVNPHFLYNTLDAIQAEVRKGNSKTAESMIQYLSEYMRIGLSYGDDFISIPQEIQHANAYIHLMEQRFGKKITFIHQIAPGLTDVQIPKTILQPLLENSIRHGFGIDADGMPVQLPTIEINFLLTETDMVIDVSDNGSGFDESYVLSIMYNGKDGEKRHIGLHNVYYRLSSIYGKENVSIQAESIPYYKNEVKLSIARDKVL